MALSICPNSIPATAFWNVGFRSGVVGALTEAIADVMMKAASYSQPVMDSEKCQRRMLVLDEFRVQFPGIVQFANDRNDVGCRNPELVERFDQLFQLLRRLPTLSPFHQPHKRS